MGTRADFYIATMTGQAMTDHIWLGSVGWDGYPQEVREAHGIPQAIMRKRLPHTFREAVEKMLRERDDATLPLHGWPWPWEDSRLTDNVYMFDVKSNLVLLFSFGKGPVTLSEHNQHTLAMRKYKAAHERWEAHVLAHPESEKPEPQEPPDPYDVAKCSFPDMSAIKNVTLGPRSGLIVL